MSAAGLKCYGQGHYIMVAAQCLSFVKDSLQFVISLSSHYPYQLACRKQERIALVRRKGYHSVDIIAVLQPVWYVNL